MKLHSAHRNTRMRGDAKRIPFMLWRLVGARRENCDSLNGFEDCTMYLELRYFALGVRGIVCVCVCRIRGRV
jgi:hypothetical protein